MTAPDDTLARLNSLSDAQLDLIDSRLADKERDSSNRGAERTRLVAFVSGPEPGGKGGVDTGALRSFAGSQLPDHMVPSEFVVVPEIFWYMCCAR